MPSRTASSEVGLSREQRGDRTVIALDGELDIASAPSLRERLHAALIDTGPYVVIDLSGVAFCDASGLALLVDARRRVRPGGTVVLAAPRPQLLRLLQVTGLDRVFTVHRSGDAAEPLPARPAAEQLDARSAAA
ncbi:STAS domain-containing protein [Actinomadura montaniterrae]|uniref:Anti-sigma factor antagonist n=1 Tax=Actinomadura montaniterrae TaxID=1803903 RepID=A0A6L3VU28_9ACTN|nr:STAS domain-containing protein [Actinomadura montaniterrae]KAB2371558.1 STAS domain-containing protein [Actinomadura montaniterrae]